MKRKNKVLALLLALCMTLGIVLSCPFFASAADYTTGLYISNAEHDIYIRSSSRSDSQSVGVLPKNTVIYVKECLAGDNWGRIDYGNTSGWVRLDLCRSPWVSRYVVRIPANATTENTDFAAIRTNETYGIVDGVMLCLGSGSNDQAAPCQVNENFFALAAAARAEGLAVGAYFTSTAVTAEEGSAQGAFVAEALDNADETLKLPLCIFYSAGSFTAEANPGVSDAVAAFSEATRAKGYYPGVYCDRSLAPAVVNGAGWDTYAVWLHDTSDADTIVGATMREYRLEKENADAEKYAAGKYPMTECFFDYPAGLPVVCPEGQHKQADGWVIIKDATCTEAGEIALRCTVCRKILETEPQPALGHTPVPSDPVAPTCTLNGKGAGMICSVCNEVLYEPNVVPATGHKWNDGEEKLNDDGTTIKLYSCTECGLTLQAESCFATGDISMDGTVTAEDARLALRAAVGLANYVTGGVEFALADTNNDNAITAEDARSILRCAVGLEELGTVTYRLPDGTVIDRTQPENPAEPVPDVEALTDDAAAELFTAANKLYVDWLSPVNAGPKYDKTQTIDLNGKVFTLITDGEYKTVEELTAACAKYFLPEVYEAFISANYMMINGKFYGPALTSETAGAAKIKLHAEEPEGDTCTIELALYETKDAETAASESTATLKWADDTWKFTSEFPYQIGFETAYVK